MADNLTTKADLLNPEVLAPMVQNSYQDAMVFTPLADIDRTLVGTAGSIITVPTWTSSAVAEEVAEGEEIPVGKLTQGKTTAEVKKFGVGKAFTDESDIETLGQNAQRATLEVGQALAQKTDSSLMDVALALTGEDYTMSDVTLDIDGIDAMEGHFASQENNVAYTIIVNPKNRLAINKAVREYTKGSDTGANIVLSGAVGSALGASIYATNKMPEDKAIVVFSSQNDIAKAKELQVKVSEGTLTDHDLETLNSGRPFKLFMKRDVLVETDRDASRQINYVYGTQILAPYVQNPSKVLVASLKKA